VTDGTSINAGFNIKIGNYFPVTPTTTTGVIKSFDMYFSATSSSSAQSCILYIYNAAHTQIGVSAPFVNTAATYPSGTWVNVPIADVAYTGPFYALIDYNITALPVKNFLLYDELLLNHCHQVLPGRGTTEHLLLQ